MNEIIRNKILAAAAATVLILAGTIYYAGTPTDATGAIVFTVGAFVGALLAAFVRSLSYPRMAVQVLAYVAGVIVAISAISGHRGWGTAVLICGLIVLFYIVIDQVVNRWEVTHPVYDEDPIEETAPHRPAMFTPPSPYPKPATYATNGKTAVVMCPFCGTLEYRKATDVEKESGVQSCCKIGLYVLKNRVDMKVIAAAVPTKATPEPSGQPRRIL